MDPTPVLSVRHLRKVFPVKGADDLVAVDDVSFHVGPGECVGLVGGSGCGKSTTARLITRLTDVTSGQILLLGKDVTHVRGRALRAMYGQVSMVFQNPAGSFDRRRTLGHGIAETLLNQGAGRREAEARVAELMEQCGLDPTLARRFPHEVSGGQCQRAAIARALASDPALLVCDEATSALDVTVQAQVVEMLDRIRRDRGLSLLFICHDLALVQRLTERVLIMSEGRIVESGPTREVLAHPTHDYTRRLIEACP